MNRFRRILIRREKKSENYIALLHCACALIAFRAAGAIGGKLSSAGGGVIFYAPPEGYADIHQALSDLRVVPFHFSPQGSKVIYVEENGYKT